MSEQPSNPTSTTTGTRSARGIDATAEKTSQPDAPTAGVGGASDKGLPYRTAWETTVVAVKASDINITKIGPYAAPTEPKKDVTVRTDRPIAAPLNSPAGIEDLPNHSLTKKDSAVSLSLSEASTVVAGGPKAVSREHDPDLDSEKRRYKAAAEAKEGTKSSRNTGDQDKLAAENSQSKVSRDTKENASNYRTAGSQDKPAVENRQAQAAREAKDSISNYRDTVEQAKSAMLTKGIPRWLAKPLAHIEARASLGLTEKSRLENMRKTTGEIIALHESVARKTDRTELSGSVTSLESYDDSKRRLRPEVVVSGERAGSKDAPGAVQARATVSRGSSNFWEKTAAQSSSVATGATNSATDAASAAPRKRAAAMH